MLLLTRRVGETIMIGDNIQVTVVEVKGGQVKVGIEAPKDIPVHREDVYLKILREKEKQQTEKSKS